MILSMLLSLCLAHPHESTQIHENDQTLIGPVIYIADPVYGHVSNRSAVLDPLVLSILPRHANSTFLKGHDDIYVYAGINIKSLTECNYEDDPLYCGIENGNWTLTTFIDETPDVAMLVLTLYNNRGMIIGSATHTKYKEEKCDVLQKETNIRGNGPKGAYSQKIEEKATGVCEDVAPLIDMHMVNQAAMSLYLGVK